jgi:hypothetical protein
LFEDDLKMVMKRSKTFAERSEKLDGRTENFMLYTITGRKRLQKHVPASKLKDQLHFPTSFKNRDNSSFLNEILNKL